MYSKLCLADNKKRYNFCIRSDVSFGKIKVLLNVLSQYNVVGNAVGKRVDCQGYNIVIKK